MRRGSGGRRLPRGRPLSSLLRLAGLHDASGQGYQLLRGIRGVVEQHMVHSLSQLRIHRVRRQHGRRVDDTHVEPGGQLDEAGVHRLAHSVVAPERE